VTYSDDEVYLIVSSYVALTVGPGAIPPGPKLKKWGAGNPKWAPKLKNGQKPPNSKKPPYSLVGSPVHSGSQKWAEAPKAAVEFGRVPPYSLVGVPPSPAPTLNVSTRFFIRVAAPYSLVAWPPCRLVEVRG